jgi:hypothetical protein
LKSALIGGSLRGGLHLVGLLLSQLRSKRRREAKRSAANLLSLFLDTAKYATCLAAFGGTVVGVDEGLSYAVGKERCVVCVCGLWDGKGSAMPTTSAVCCTACLI